jgi:hypothetical protein
MDNEHEDRGWLVRLIDGFRDDVRLFGEQLLDVDRLTRRNEGRIIDLERRVENVEGESKDTTISVVEIKAIAKTAGLLGGFVAGVLGAVLTAFIFKLAHLSP